MPPCDSLLREFGNFEERCQNAVNIAIGSMTLHEDSQMAVAWINHRHGHSCAALRVANLTNLRLLTECGKRLLCCFVDFAIKPNWLTLALGPIPPPSLPCERMVVQSSEPWARASGMAICSMERPSPVSTWHMVPVPETPVVAPQPRIRLLAPLREKPKNTKQGNHDYGYLHAFGASERRGKSSEKERGRSGASATAAGLASTAEGPASAPTKTEERKDSPQRLVIAETPT